MSVLNRFMAVLGALVAAAGIIISAVGNNSHGECPTQSCLNQTSSQIHLGLVVLVVGLILLVLASLLFVVRKGWNFWGWF
jgi:hypothetical protein